MEEGLGSSGSTFWDLLTLVFDKMPYWYAKMLFFLISIICWIVVILHHKEVDDRRFKKELALLNKLM